MGLLRLPMVDFPAVLLTTAVLLIQMQSAVLVAALKALRLYQALLVVLNGAAVLAVEAELMGQLATVVAVDQFLAAVVVVAAVILHLVFLDAVLAVGLQLT
jgi:hypothetical protein